MRPLPSCTAGTERHVLPNGLTVLLQRYPTAPIVAVVTHVKTGYFDEPDEWVGISHVLEHMCFKGTARHGVGDIARLTKEVGGYINAATSYERTQYYTVLPAEGLARAIDLQSDALFASTLDPAELEREISVIIEEAHRKLDAPSAVTTETLYAMLFDRHRMRRWRIGTDAELRNLTRDDVLRFYRSRYVPRNVIVSIVGDIDPAATLALVEASYGTAPDRSPAVDPSPVEPEHAEFRSRTLHGDAQQAIVGLGWRTFGSEDPRTPRLDVLPWILTAGRGSWGHQVLRAPAVARSVGCAHYTPADVGVFQLTAETAAETALTALERLWALMAHVEAGGLSTADLDRAKALAATHFARRFESVDGRATTLAVFEAQGGYEESDAYLGRFFEADAAAIQRTARTCRLDNAAAIAFFPASTDASLPADLRDRLATAGHPEIRPPVAPLRSGASGVHAAAAVEWWGRLAVARSETVDIVVLRKPDVPLVTVGIAMSGGPRQENDAFAGVTLLALRTALRGAGSYGRLALAAAAEHLGGSLSAVVAPDWAGWQVTVRADEVLPASELLLLVAQQARFQATDLAEERDALRQDARRLRDDMYHYPIRLALRAALPGDSYGLPLVGTEESVPRIRDDQVRQWHRRVLGERRLAVFVVGDVEPEREVARLSGLFGGWTGSTRPPAASVEWRAGAEARERRDRKQSALSLAFPGPAEGESDRFVVEIITTIASGLGGRLFDELRERRALAYSVSAAPWFARDAGGVIAYVATGPDRLSEAHAAMLEECRRFAETPVSDPELQRAVRYAIGLRKIGRQRGSALFGELVRRHLGGDDLEAWDEDATALERVTRDDVLRVASAIFSHEPAVGVIEGRGAGSG